MRAKPDRSARRVGSLPALAGVIVLAVVGALVTQKMLAEQVAGFLAGVWVQAMNVIIGLISAIFGGAT